MGQTGRIGALLRPFDTLSSHARQGVEPANQAVSSPYASNTDSLHGRVRRHQFFASAAILGRLSKLFAG